MVIQTIKDNKLIVALIILFGTSGLYVGALNVAEPQNSTFNATPPAQQIIINGSEGFSLNGNVTNIVAVTESGNNNMPVQKDVGSAEAGIIDAGITGERYDPEV